MYGSKFPVGNAGTRHEVVVHGRAETPTLEGSRCMRVGEVASLGVVGGTRVVSSRPVRTIEAREVELEGGFRG